MAVNKATLDRRIIALYDLGSRDGATANGVMRQLKKDGFTVEEINAAIKHFNA